jgi:pSer/pThr/pTyr-binding forkhead associated (FHA) protein
MPDTMTGAFLMSQPARPGQPNPHVERSGTLIETDEEVRQAISGLKGQGQAESPPTATSPVAQTANRGPSATLFRPTVRPPMAVLTVCDDGKLDGEVIRIRDQRFVIGRTEGDLKIPIDGRISSRHVEITLQTVGGLHRWVVTDLQSTHGTFVRVSRTVLADRAEFLVGNGRYRFDSPQSTADATVGQVTDPAVSGETQGWDGSPSPLRPPAVTELIGYEIGNRMLLVKPEYWIGADPTCSICRSDDPFCEPKHVRLFRAPNGSWYAEHNRTQNGLWLRMSQIVVDSVVRFQIGEQRFLLRV